MTAGIGDHRIVTTLCAGGNERMRRLMGLARHGRFDLTPLITHHVSLENIVKGYRIFGEHRVGVPKVAVTP